MTRKIVMMLGLLLALSSVPAAAADVDDSPTPALPVAEAIVKPRPQIVPSLYVSLAVLQAFDGYSTLRGVRNGAREANPILGQAAGRPIAIWTLKAASTATTIYCAERLWRTSEELTGLRPTASRVALPTPPIVSSAEDAGGSSSLPLCWRR